MTRQYTKDLTCDQCGSIFSAETSFSRWVRYHELLDSHREGLSIVDQDFWVHKYKTALGREFQCAMLVEVKTQGRTLSKSQRDTLFIVRQLIRNRRATPTKRLVNQAGHGPLIVYSPWLKRRVVLRAFGVFVLRMEGTSPANSSWMTWNDQTINEDQLIQLLRFDLDPDTLQPIDFRRHHRQPVRKQQALGE